MATVCRCITKQNIDVLQCVATEQSKTVDSGRGQCSERDFLCWVPRPQFSTRFQEKFAFGRNHVAIIERTQLLGLLKKEN